MLRKILSGIILTMLFVAARSQQIDKAKLDLFFDRLAEKEKAMGSLVILKDGKEIYSRSIGYSQINGAEKMPLTAANKFRIGSVTKTFTATIIMQLVDEGKLKLSDPLSKFLPQVPNAEKITIRQILSHRSGIPEISRENRPGEIVKTMPMSKEEHLKLIVNATPNFEPGTKMQYSNSGYFILGLVIEKITGKSYADVLAEKIVEKTGLNNTYLATGNIDVSKHESLTYFMVPGGDWKTVPETHPSLLFSAGGIVSTPYDLAAFMHALFNGKLVSKESLEQMVTMIDGEGFGMVTFPYVGRTFYGHTGGADNYGAWLNYLPEERLAIAYTTNAKVYPVKDIMAAVFDIYYQQPFEIPSFEPVAVGVALLDKYVGTYSLAGAPVKFIVSREGGTLYAKPMGLQNPFPLEATAQDKFRVDNGTATGIVFEFDIEKNQMTVKRDGGARVFTKEN